MTWSSAASCPRDGRSRAYLNGQAVPLQLLREAGNILYRHSRPTRISVPDADRRRSGSCSTVTRKHDSLSRPSRHCAPGVGRDSQQDVGPGNLAPVDREAKLELLRYQVQELNALQLKEGEVLSLTEERARLSNRGGRLGGRRASSPANSSSKATKGVRQRQRSAARCAAARPGLGGRMKLAAVLCRFPRKRPRSRSPKRRARWNSIARRSMGIRPGQDWRWSDGLRL